MFWIEFVGLPWVKKKTTTNNPSQSYKLDPKYNIRKTEFLPLGEAYQVTFVFTLGLKEGIF